MLKGKSILVVDDEPDLREILCDEFSLIGASVAGASNGTEAFLKIKAEHFDIVVSDLRMPGGDGISLARNLKAHPASPVLILMTGFADLTAEDAFEIGAEGFLTKPFHLESVRETLARLLTPPRDRWSMLRNSGLDLHIDLSAYTGKPVLKYLGRGGIFLPGERFAARTGTEVNFNIGSWLQGSGVVRWVRPGPANGRSAGVGVEFLYLESKGLDEVQRLLATHQPTAYLPKGF